MCAKLKNFRTLLPGQCRRPNFSAIGLREKLEKIPRNSAQKNRGLSRISWTPARPTSRSASHDPQECTVKTVRYAQLTDA